MLIIWLQNKTASVHHLIVSSRVSFDGSKTCCISAVYVILTFCAVLCPMNCLKLHSHIHCAAVVVTSCVLLAR